MDISVNMYMYIIHARTHTHTHTHTHVIHSMYNIHVIYLNYLYTWAGLQLDGALGWSWFGVTTPLWIPIGLCAPIFCCAPFAIWKQLGAAGDDPALQMQVCV
jgi:hypothetical protein